MRAVRGRDTTPEMVVRRLAFSMGYRYRLHVKNLPGKPDLVFGSKRKIIFVNGCFWHLHRCRHGLVSPTTNKAYWDDKRHGNALRDKANAKSLRDEGWKVLTIWECGTRDPVSLSGRLSKFLGEPSCKAG